MARYRCGTCRQIFKLHSEAIKHVEDQHIDGAVIDENPIGLRVEGMRPEVEEVLDPLCNSWVSLDNISMWECKHGWKVSDRFLSTATLVELEEAVIQHDEKVSMQSVLPLDV